MNLPERIDTALQRAGLSRAELTRLVQLSPNALAKLGPDSDMRASNIAKMAKALGCSHWWLATGEGRYRKQEYIDGAEWGGDAAQLAAVKSYIALEIARWVDSMPEREQERAFAMVYAMTKGNWPVLLPIGGNGHPPVTPKT